MKKAERNKWLKYKFMKASKQLSRYLPETKIMTEKSVWAMMEKYGHIIAKPVKGSRGVGVIQVSSRGNDTYEIHYENKRFYLYGKDATYDYLKRTIGYRLCVVQRRIPRATVGGRPFDMRVIVQRKSNSNNWKVTAKVAKVAGSGYIVSNITRSNGTLLPVRTALKSSSLNHLSSKKLRSKVNKVSLRCAKTLSRYFKGHRIYGLDVALDNQGQVWIIEGNLFPLMSHFLKMDDKTMYNRIMRYKNS